MKFFLEYVQSAEIVEPAHILIDVVEGAFDRRIIGMFPHPGEGTQSHIEGGVILLLSPQEKGNKQEIHQSRFHVGTMTHQIHCNTMILKFSDNIRESFNESFAVTD